MKISSCFTLANYWLPAPRSNTGSETQKRLFGTITITALKVGGFTAGLMAFPAYSAIVTWSDNTPTNDWFESSNWISGVPATNDLIYIGNTAPAGAAVHGSAVIGTGNAQGSKLWLGYAPGTSGTLTVMSGGSLEVGSLYLGELGTGTLGITGGTVNVSDSFQVGGFSGLDAGSGHLEISQGGILNQTGNSYTYVGYSPSTLQSTVLIDGSESAWNTAGGVIIGAHGNGTGKITVQNGGQLSLSNPSGSQTNGGLGLADGPDATGTLTIDGLGSKVTTTPGITIGIAGKGHLSILNGATLESSSDRIDYDYLGYLGPTANGPRPEGHVSVDGPGSSWINHTGLVVGYTGIGTMAITHGASVTSTYASYIGLSAVTGAPAAAHGEVLISGPESIWSTGTLDMASYNSASGVLTVANGGTLKTTGAAGIRSVGSGGQGTINIGAAQGELAVAPGVLDTPILNLGAQGTLVFNHDSSGYTFSPKISSVAAGNGTVNQLAGTTILTGDSGAYSGVTHVVGGTLRVDGALGSAASTLSVSPGGTLGGGGTIGGDVTIADGGNLAPSAGGTASASTLTIGGNLVLNDGSVLNYNFGQANTVGGALNDLTVVQGDLTLDGTLNVTTTPTGSFGPGVYRVISYNGSLINNGLALGSLPMPDFEVQTSVSGQVNLVNIAGQPLTFWNGGNAALHGNGVVHGGNGVWQNQTGNTHWTDISGDQIGPWDNGNFAVFMAAPGMVTVDNSLGQVSASGMQFASDGYVVQGDDITLAGPQSTLRVGDGSSLGAGYTATIDANLAGDSQLVKSDLGTLVLAGANTYTGGTAINGGTLSISADDNLGARPGALSLDGGTLNTAASFTTARDTTLDAGGGTFAIDPDARLTLAGTIHGTGNLTKDGTGTLILNGNANHYSGDTTVMSGTLQAGAANTFSDNSTVTVANTGTLDLAGFDQRVAGLGNTGLVSMGTDTPPGTILTVNGNYAGDGGGTIMFNTRLGGDKAPTDQMVVNGSTSGTSLVKVTNASGPGGWTAEGIKIIDVTGTSDGVFTLLGDYQTRDDKPAIVAGAYAYTLEKNGIGTPTDGNWYLRSGFSQNPETPRFQPGVPVYEAYAQTLLGLNGVPTLQQRIGNRAWSGNGHKALEGTQAIGTPDATPGTAGHHIEGNGVWGRIEGTRHQIRPGLSTAGVNYDQDIFKLQTGIDSLLIKNESSKLIGGIALHYTHGLSKTASIHDAKAGGGRISTDGYGLSGTLTRYAGNGVYLDSQAQMTWYDSDLSHAGSKPLASGNHGFGYTLSLEGGQRIALDPAWSITPQAQLVYSQVKFDRFHDDHDTAVSLGQGGSLLGRLGLALDYENSGRSPGGMTNRTHAYGIVNLYHEFLNGTQVDVADVSLNNRKDRLWGGVGVGGSYNWNKDKYSIYGEALVNTSLVKFADSHTLQGNIGFRMRW